MHITQLDTYFLSIPLPQPVRTSTNTIRQVSEVIVKLTTDAGLVGIGEAHGPFLFQQGPEGLRVVNDIIQRITPLVVGVDPFRPIPRETPGFSHGKERGLPIPMGNSPMAHRAKSVALYRIMCYKFSMEKKQFTSMRLSPEAKRLLVLLAQRLGISQTAVLELALRDKAKREGVK